MTKTTHATNSLQTGNDVDISEILTIIDDLLEEEEVSFEHTSVENVIGRVFLKWVDEVSITRHGRAYFITVESKFMEEDTGERKHMTCTCKIEAKAVIRTLLWV